MKKLLFLFTFCFIANSLFAFQQEKLDAIPFKKFVNTELSKLYNAETDFGGATIGIVLPNGDAHAFAIGNSNVTKKTPMKPKDRMLGGSTGKVFLSAALMQLVEKNKIQLDDKISMYLGKHSWYKQIQNYESITIRNLMQHASGISRYVYNEQFQIDIHKDADRKWKPEELLSYVFDEKPLFKAGSEFEYSDTNYIILAMVLEEVTKTSMYNYISKNILKPFKLNDVTPQVNRKIRGLIDGYNKKDDPLFPGDVLVNGKYKYNVQFEWAGGGFAITSVDLAKAGKLIYEGQAFDKNLLPEFFKGINAKQLGGTWGLGVHIRKNAQGTSYGHSGFFPGYITNMLYFPESKFSIAFQVNTSNPENLTIYRKLFKLIPTLKKYISDVE
mgnify:CR=1 FL=1